MNRYHQRRPKRPRRPDPLDPYGRYGLARVKRPERADREGFRAALAHAEDAVRHWHRMMDLADTRLEHQQALAIYEKWKAHVGSLRAELAELEKQEGT